MKQFSPGRPKIILFNKFLTKLAQKKQFIKRDLEIFHWTQKHELANLRFEKVIGT